MTKGKLIKYFILGIIVACIATFWWTKDSRQRKEVRRDYAGIEAEGVIRAVTEYNSISYHVAGDSLSGFHYKLINAFAKEHGLKAEVTPLMGYSERLKGLATGKYDLIACGIPITAEWKDSLLFTIPITRSKQVLVQRKVDSGNNSHYIQSLLDLAGKKLYVVKDSPFILRIRNLENEIGDTIYVEEVERYGSEQLISLVAHGDIDYTVCDENIARAAADSFPQIDINTAVSFSQFYAWGVSKKAPALLDSLNAFLTRELSITH